MKRDIENYIAAVQTDAYVDTICTRMHTVECSLGVFNDGNFFIWIADGGLPRITPMILLAGPWCDVMPVHVTLGKTCNCVDEKKLASVVQGTFTIRLAKWSKRRKSSTYLVESGLEAVLAECESMGFRPRKRWHISL